MYWREMVLGKNWSHASTDKERENIVNQVNFYLTMQMLIITLLHISAQAWQGPIKYGAGKESVYCVTQHRKDTSV